MFQVKEVIFLFGSIVQYPWCLRCYNNYAVKFNGRLTPLFKIRYIIFLFIHKNTFILSYDFTDTNFTRKNIFLTGGSSTNMLFKVKEYCCVV